MNERKSVNQRSKKETLKDLLIRDGADGIPLDISRKVLTENNWDPIDMVEMQLNSTVPFYRDISRYLMIALENGVDTEELTSLFLRSKKDELEKSRKRLRKSKEFHQVRDQITELNYVREKLNN